MSNSRLGRGTFLLVSSSLRQQCDRHFLCTLYFLLFVTLIPNNVIQHCYLSVKSSAKISPKCCNTATPTIRFQTTTKREPCL